MGRMLDNGDESVVGVHIMDVYAEPLRVYCLGCSLKWVGEPEDLVSGFFADRLSRPAFLTRWRESQRPLRFWLIVGFKHFLYEEARRRNRDKRMDADPGVDLPSPNRDYERSCAMGIVRRALTVAASACAENGLAEHWEIFEMFHLKEMTLQQIAEVRGIAPTRTSVMKRTATKHFQRCLRDMVSWDGATEGDVDAEISGLMEGLS